MYGLIMKFICNGKIFIIQRGASIGKYINETQIQPT